MKTICIETVHSYALIIMTIIQLDTRKTSNSSKYEDKQLKQKGNFLLITYQGDMTECLVYIINTFYPNS